MECTARPMLCRPDDSSQKQEHRGVKEMGETEEICGEIRCGDIKALNTGLKHRQGGVIKYCRRRAGATVKGQLQKEECGEPRGDLSLRN